MAFQLVVKHTFWELETSPEEPELPAGQHRPRAYTDMCCSYSSSFTSTDSDSTASMVTGSSVPSSDCSVAGDVSKRWADICDDGDNDLLSASTVTGSSVASSDCSGDASERWADICDDGDDDLPSPPSPPLRPAGTWFVPASTSWAKSKGTVQACSPLEAQMAAAMEKAKARAAAEVAQAKAARAEGKSQKVKTSCDLCDRTTLIFRKLPKDMTRTSFLEMLDTAGLKGLYDFVYLPMDLKKGRAFGYAIVNFVTHAAAQQAKFHFEGEGVALDWSDSHQGFDELIQRYRDSPIMHSSTPEMCKPIIFCNGVVSAFPSPSKEIQPLSKN